MSSDFTLVDPKGWEYDLQSVYSAYVGYFQMNNVQWYDRSWGHLFESFDEFLTFSWPVVTVTDAWTGRAHIVTRLTSIGAFIKMVKTRFGETLPQPPNILIVTPFETSNRHLRHISDYPSYRKLHATLPATILSAFKARVRAGEPKAIKELWDKRDKTYLSIDIEWSERNEKSCLEWGYAALRCAHLDALQHWPPEPDANYRKGHFVVAEYIDKVSNKHRPNYPWKYSFGESQVIPKSKVPQIMKSVISSIISPDSETLANNLVLVTHGGQGDLTRLEEMGIKLPHNLIVLDTATFELNLFASGYRGATMMDPRTKQPRLSNAILSLDGLIRSFPNTEDLMNRVVLNNSGNDAFITLFALQMMLEGIEGTKIPTPKVQKVRKLSGMGLGGIVVGTDSSRTPSPFDGMPMGYLHAMPTGYNLTNEFGSMSMRVPGHGTGSGRNYRK